MKCVFILFQAELFFFLWLKLKFNRSRFIIITHTSTLLHRVQSEWGKHQTSCNLYKYSPAIFISLYSNLYYIYIYIIFFLWIDTIRYIFFPSVYLLKKLDKYIRLHEYMLLYNRFSIRLRILHSFIGSYWISTYWHWRRIIWYNIFNTRLCCTQYFFIFYSSSYIKESN